VKNKLQLLAIAAHPDDVELGCAGTLIKHIQKGQKAGIVDLTLGELGTRGTPEIRWEESLAAANIMGATIRDNLKLADGFFQIDQSSLLKLIVRIRKYQPEMVLANALEDRHPDHGRGGKLISDACFLAGLRKIETTDDDGHLQLPWRPKKVLHMIQDRLLNPSLVVDITDVMEQKMEAIKAYKTQFHNPNSDEPLTYISTSSFLEHVESRAMTMGKMIGVKYGEGFVVPSGVGLSDLDALQLPQMP